jgi:peptidoglycan/LPS O-acetylase OafA/YrhL
MLGTTFISSSLKDVLIENSMCKYINFTTAKINNVIIDSSDLSGMTFYETNIKNIEFDEVNLNIINNLFGRGDFGVDVFFFLSAYGLTYSINKNLICTFYLNRIKRIMPIYVLFLIGCVLFFITTDFSQILNYILASITGGAALKECHFQVEWYTPSLLFVYWFFPLINFVSKKIAKLNVCIIAVSIILLHFFCYHIDIGLCHLLAYRIPIIILGCVCYYLDKDDSRNIYSVLSILAIWGLFLFPGKVKLAIPAIVYLIGKSDKLPFHNCISVCGKYSFEIYLAQVVTTKYFIL